MPEFDQLNDRTRLGVRRLDLPHSWTVDAKSSSFMRVLLVLGQFPSEFAPGARYEVTNCTCWAFKHSSNLSAREVANDLHDKRRALILRQLSD